MPPLPTKNGTRRLSEVTRELVKPAGIVSTGWPAVRDKCRDLGVPFDEWQDGAGRLILAKRADGKLAAKVGGVGMSLPRQVGKTYLLGALIFALAILKPGLLIIWTAHHARTSSETFLSMQGFAKRRKIAPYIEAIYKGSGDEAVVFHNRSRILFGARERGFGRGIPGVDVLMCDEAQILTERALSNMLPTLNISKLGLVVYVGTPPRPEDPSEAFVRMRDDALSGEAEDLVWIECGADPDASPDDREQWAKANPSFPHRTPEEALLRLRRKLGEESFLREGLGIWEDLTGALAFGVGKWEACANGGRPKDLGLGALSVAVSYELTHGAIGAASVLDGHAYVKPLQHGQGTYWLVRRAKELQTRYRVDVVVDNMGPAKFLIPDLRAAGVRLKIADTNDVLDACAGIFDLVQEQRLHHESFDDLDAAVAAAVKRSVGDRWAWGRRSSTADISSLEAVTLAAWWAAQRKPQPLLVVSSRIG